MKKKQFPLNLKTGETVKTFEQYYLTEHWRLLIIEYITSKLEKRCSICKQKSNNLKFKHRTTCRLGKERLNDIMPFCPNCANISKISRSKKKTERRQLSPLSFKIERLEEKDQTWFLSIPPKLRGYLLSQYFAKKGKPYNASSQWINLQVKKTCKWINKTNQGLLRSVIENI